MPHSSSDAFAKHHHFRSTSANRFTTESRGFQDTVWNEGVLCRVDDLELFLELNLSGAVCQDTLDKSVRVVGQGTGYVLRCLSHA